MTAKLPQTKKPLTIKAAILLLVLSPVLAFGQLPPPPGGGGGSEPPPPPPGGGGGAEPPPPP